MELRLYEAVQELMELRLYEAVQEARTVKRTVLKRAPPDTG